MCRKALKNMDKAENMDKAKITTGKTKLRRSCEPKGRNKTGNLVADTIGTHPEPGDQKDKIHLDRLKAFKIKNHPMVSQTTSTKTSSVWFECEPPKMVPLKTDHNACST